MSSIVYMMTDPGAYLSVSIVFYLTILSVQMVATAKRPWQERQNLSMTILLLLALVCLVWPVLWLINIAVYVWLSRRANQKKVVLEHMRKRIGELLAEINRMRSKIKDQ